MSNVHYDNLTACELDSRTNTLVFECERAIFLARPSVMFGLVPIPDGNQWSVLYGENLMEGVAGFGDTPDEAMADFDKNWKTQTLNKP